MSKINESRSLAGLDSNNENVDKEFDDHAFKEFDEPQLKWSDAPTFQEVISSQMSRRKLLGGSVAVAFGSFFTTTADTAHASGSSSGLGFIPVPASDGNNIVVPHGYSYQVILPWGMPITGTYPSYSLDNTGAEQGMQMGMHHDGMHFFPLTGKIGNGNPGHYLSRHFASSDDGLLVMNHEYVEPRLMHASVAGKPGFGILSVPNEDGNVLSASAIPLQLRDPDEVLKEINGHGVSVVRMTRNHGEWTAVQDPRNRRITAGTPMKISGPLRGHGSVKTKYSPQGTHTRGTLNNCAHGVTPWGTYLACEENIWYYFTNLDFANAPASMRRYNVGGFNFFRWDRASNGADEFARFDITPTAADATQDYRNEGHCFGWVVEIDPYDPGSMPVKRTHLGRFSHEGAVFAPARPGKPVVVYSGDDTTGGYIYKFVSKDKFHPIKTDGSILDEGTLYGARFDDDGTGKWLALVPGQNNLTPENGFPDLQSILLNARGACDVAGATPMDRPEWGTVDPKTNEVYFSLTNNSRRSETNAANPRVNNIYGHIIRWSEKDRFNAGTSFKWDIFMLSGNETNSMDPKGDPLTEDNIHGSPDGLWADPDGRLWIQTDASDGSLNDPNYAGIGNNMMLAADPDTGDVRRFLTGPQGCEITGVVTTPDQRTMFVNVQHPGASTSSSDFAAGNFSSNWPSNTEGNYPRSATVLITKDDGGKIGT